MDIYSLTLKKNTEEKIHIKSSGEELGAFSHPNTSIPSLRERKNSGKSYGKKNQLIPDTSRCTDLLSI